jgi:hypothetical protein
MVLMRVRKLGFAQLVMVSLCAVFSGLSFLAVSAGAVTLPDGRVYEAVSPVASEGAANVNVPYAGFVVLTRFGEHGLTTFQPLEAAADGGKVVYAGDTPATGGEGSFGMGEGEEYLATRSAGGGWRAQDIEPGANEIIYSANEVRYQAFSTDLSTGMLISRRTPAFAAGGPANCAVLYSRTNGDGFFHPAFTTTQTPGECGQPEFDGMSADNSHLLFSSRAALIPGAVGGQNNLYESSDDKLHLVNLLPDGKIAIEASIDNGRQNTVSADGSLVFWTDLDMEASAENPTGETSLFVRKNGDSPAASTVKVDGSVGGGGNFLGASRDGSKAFFTKDGDLYQYEVGSGQTTDLAAGANVQGVLGVSDDGSFVYFVAGGVLANNENGEKEKATLQGCEASDRSGAGGAPCNLYVRHEGVTTFITTLSARDGGSVNPFEGGSDWNGDVTDRTAYVTPNGRSLVFMSDRSLTGYDNETTYFEESNTEYPRTMALDEVFLYGADSRELWCVSCNPTGEPPVPTEYDTYKQGYPLGAFIPLSDRSFRPPGNAYQPRVTSEDGSRVFFDSAEPLVPQDTNGWLDVYEWERDGSGGCRDTRGCVYLLSGGTIPESSYLLDAGSSGDDVFIITRAQLVPADRNDNDDVYDARVGGVQPATAPACAGSGCQGVPPAPPIFATPSSVTFEGVGNFPSSSKRVEHRKKLGKRKRCRRGSVRKHGQCVAKKAGKPVRGRK